MENLLYKCMTKATDKENGDPGYSKNWIYARRAMFKIFEKQIRCGDWVIELDKIENMTLYKTKQGFFPVEILKVEMDHKIYQFGFNPWANPMKYIKMDYETKDIKLKYSKFSIIYRIFLIVILIAIFLLKYLNK